MNRRRVDHRTGKAPLPCAKPAACDAAPEPARLRDPTRRAAKAVGHGGTGRPRHPARRTSQRSADGKAAAEVDPATVRWFRLGRSGLTLPCSSMLAATTALVGVQAQILSAAGLAIANRTPADGFHRADLDHALHRHRSLVRIWAWRGTLHLFSAEDWPLVHGALAGRATWQERSWARAGRPPEQWRAMVSAVAALLAERGTIGRQDLEPLGLDPAAISSWGGVFADLVRRGLACHAASEGQSGRFAWRQSWLPRLRWRPPASEIAEAEIMRRYLGTFGPATAADYAVWRGTTQTDARRIAASLGAELTVVLVAGTPHWLLAKDLPWLSRPLPGNDPDGDPGGHWPVRLLGRFDPLLLGHRDRSWLLPAAWRDAVVRPAGHLEAVMLAPPGIIVGTWRYDRERDGLRVTLRPFRPLAPRLRQAFVRETRRIGAFFGTDVAAVAIERARAPARSAARMTGTSE